VESNRCGGHEECQEIAAGNYRDFEDWQSWRNAELGLTSIRPQKSAIKGRQNLYNLIAFCRAAPRNIENHRHGSDYGEGMRIKGKHLSESIGIVHRRQEEGRSRRRSSYRGAPIGNSELQI